MKTVDEIMVAAFNFQEVPDPDLPAPECLLWYMLRDIYDRYKNKIITERQGKEEKDKAIRLYNMHKSDLQEAKDVIRQHALLWKNIEVSADRYRLDRTLENADSFIETVYQVGIRR